MKNNFKNIGLALILMSGYANAQQWIGSNSPNADITRTGNVAIGTSVAPTATLDVRGTVRLQTINNDETAKKVMMIDKDNLVVYKDISTLFTVGCATTNYLTKRTAAGALSCSSILDDGSKVTIGTGTSTIFDATSLNVGKNVKVSGTTQMADNAFVVTTGSLPTKYLYFKNENKISPSNIWKMGNTRYNSPDPYITYNGFSLIEGDTNVTRLFVQDGTGKVGIGTVSLNCTGCDDYLLFVKKGIKSERIKVEISGLGGWADNVFANDYKLRPLSEVEKYIDENKHLPEIPSAQEVVANGVDLGEMNKLLLQKVEELTLYIIKQEKDAKKQSADFEALKVQVQTLLEKK